MRTLGKPQTGLFGKPFNGENKNVGKTRMHPTSLIFEEAKGGTLLPLNREPVRASGRNKHRDTKDG